MTPLQPVGTPWPSFVKDFTAMTHVRDLLAYEGPLLSEFRARQGDTYLLLWRDRDEEANRWLAFQVSGLGIARYLAAKVSLAQLLDASTGAIFLLDIDSDYQPRAAYAMSASELSPDLRPPADSFYPDAQDRGEYEVFLGQKWAGDQLRGLRNSFEKAYAFRYAFGRNEHNTIRRRTQRALPWKGGFSAMHHSNRLTGRLPPSASARLAAVHFSSPGFVRWTLDGGAARSVAESVARYLSAPVPVRQAVSQAQRFLKANGLNLDHADTLPGTDGDLDRLAEALAEALGDVDLAAIRRDEGSSFRTLKVLMWYVRRIQELAELVELECVEL